MRKCIIVQFRSDIPYSSGHACLARVQRIDNQYKMHLEVLLAAVFWFVQLGSAQWGPSVVDTNTGKVR